MTTRVGRTPARSDEDLTASENPRVHVAVEWVVVAATMVALFVLLAACTLTQPYHLDTTAYFESLRDWEAGRITCPYGTRCMVSYYLLPFAGFGEQAVKIGFVTAATLFFLFSYRFLSRALSAPTAYVSSLMVLAIPAGLVTVTHLKEDFVGLMFLAAALWLAMSPSLTAKLASGVAFSLALLSKEPFLLFVPFYVGVLWYSLFLTDRVSPSQTWREGRRWLVMSAVIVGSAALTLVLNHEYVGGLLSLSSSPYRGQFKGPFSDLLPHGLKHFERAFGANVLFWFQLVGLVALVVEKDRRRRVLLAIFVVNAVLLALISMNMTTVTYRHFVVVAFLTLPPATYGLERLAGPKWLYLTTGMVIVAIVVRAYPYVAFHARYNPQEAFFAGLKDEIGDDAVLLTMDYAGLAKHYVGSRTKQHVPDPDEVEAEAFVASVRDDPAHTYYMLPDAVVYDAKGTFRARLQTAFELEPVYEEWFEDYHRLDYDYGYRPDELASELARETGCGEVSYELEGTEAVGSMPLERYRYELTCPGLQRTGSYLAYEGTVLMALRKARVYRLVARDGS